MTKRIFLFLISIITLVRFFFIEEALLEPHAWRQSDTANYILSFYQDGIDLLHPTVCWLGGYKVLILEFPLVEAVVALFYHVFGPFHIVAKIVFLIFFLGSCYYLYQLIKYLYNEKIAQLTTLFYSLAPLSIFYSIAIHIDFAELFFVFGMAFYYLKGIDKGSTRDVIYGSLFAVIAFLTKIPYAIIFSLPLVYRVFEKKQLIFVLRHLLIFSIPISFFLFWQHHVETVNGAAPNWEYIPGYRKFTFNTGSGWYFGTIGQRLDITNWMTIGNRLFTEITGTLGVLLVFLGLFLGKINRFLWLWLLATVVYVFIFFNLNLVHNYYQIPFIAVLCVFMAIGADEGRKWLGLINPLWFMVPIVLFALESHSYAGMYYFQVRPMRVAIGEAINKSTKPEDLIIINHGKMDSKCPLFLYEARRNGWQVLTWKLDAALIFKLVGEGANYAAFIRDGELEQELTTAFKDYSVQEIDLIEGKKMFLYQFSLKR